MNKTLMNHDLNNIDIGGKYPYLLQKESETYIFNNMKEFIGTDFLKKPKLDIPSVYSMLSFGYIIGDESLVKGVTRLPWMSKIKDDGEITHYDFENYNKITLNNES